MARTALLLITCIIGTCVEAQNVSPPKDPCITAVERERLLALDQKAFDQDLSGNGGGWRAIAAKTGCTLAAADLIRDYRERHSSAETIIYWHEGQLRAEGDDYPAAIALFEKSRGPKESDGTGWNPYVDASIAFLKKDKAALLRAREELSAVKAPADMQLKDGVFEIPTNTGKSFKMRWPPNIDVVEGLINCFEKSYREAYSTPQCRPAPPQ
ncbi:MAG: hypothetical protein QM808_12230 [Steroidobacteraceae bacterium]